MVGKRKTAPTHRQWNPFLVILLRYYSVYKSVGAVPSSHPAASRKPSSNWRASSRTTTSWRRERQSRRVCAIVKLCFKDDRRMRDCKKFRALPPQVPMASTTKSTKSQPIGRHTGVRSLTLAFSTGYCWDPGYSWHIGYFWDPDYL